MLSTQFCIRFRNRCFTSILKWECTYNCNQKKKKSKPSFIATYFYCNTAYSEGCQWDSSLPSHWQEMLGMHWTYKLGGCFCRHKEWETQTQNHKFIRYCVCHVTRISWILFILSSHKNYIANQKNTHSQEQYNPKKEMSQKMWWLYSMFVCLFCWNNTWLATGYRQFLSIWATWLLSSGRNEEEKKSRTCTGLLLSCAKQRAADRPRLRVRVRSCPPGQPRDYSAWRC